MKWSSRRENEMEFLCGRGLVPSHNQLILIVWASFFISSNQLFFSRSGRKKRLNLIHSLTALRLVPRSVCFRHAEEISFHELKFIPLHFILSSSIKLLSLSSSHSSNQPTLLLLVLFSLRSIGRCAAHNPQIKERREELINLLHSRPHCAQSK